MSVFRVVAMAVDQDGGEGKEARRDGLVVLLYVFQDVLDATRLEIDAYSSV